MSLKHFHIIFIVASWLLAFGCAAWCFFTPDGNGSRLYLLGGIASLMAGVSLVGYNVWVWKKMKKIYIG